ncbi:MAG: HAD-IA family hydrolase [Acidimicrobiia bacterium]
MTIEAVVFDLGGVILDSPLDAIAAFEQRHSIRPGSINRHVFASGSGGAWARHERGEVGHAEFLAMFRSEFESAGIDVDTAELMADIDTSIRVRPEMLLAVDRLRNRGIRVAALTNNWTPFGPEGLAAHFDVVVESVVEGTRKPESRIYEICIERLGVAPAACVMLDDLGPNLKPALAMGMRTVKVTSVAQALAELEAIFGPLTS